MWTSQRRRCLSTCKPLADLGYKVSERQQMHELNPGVIDGLTQDEIKERFPQEFQRAQGDQYSHRYPRAESYHDLSVRLEPVILELERERQDVVVIGHASVIRCLLAYLQGLAPSSIPSLQIRRGDVIEVTPTAYGVDVTAHQFWSEEPEEIRGIAASPAQSPNLRPSKAASSANSGPNQSINPSGAQAAAANAPKSGARTPLETMHEIEI